eukprot:2702054-Pleurochrysis_carterae.AAC.1
MLACANLGVNAIQRLRKCDDETSVIRCKRIWKWGWVKEVRVRLTWCRASPRCMTDALQLGAQRPMRPGGCSRGGWPRQASGSNSRTRRAPT